MAPRGTHTVFGFDCGLDWWPTAFVNGISSNRVCSVCGLVPANMALLPCRHVLCKPCYDGCTSNSNRCCLDGRDILPDDVVWCTFSVDSFLDRKIQCWNASNGCDVSGAVPKVMAHFITKCQHHAVPCPRCKRSIAHKDIVNHIESGLCTQAAVTECVTSEDTASGVAQIVTALGNLDTKVSSLQASFKDDLRCIADGVEMSLERAAQHSPVVASIQGLDNTLKENVQLSRSAIAEVAEAHAVLQNNISAIVTCLEQAKSLVAELEALPNRICEAQKTEALAVRDSIKSDIDALSTASVAERKEIAEKLKELEGLLRERMNTKPASEENLEQYHNEVIGKLSFLEAVAQNAFSNEVNSVNTLEWTIEQWSEVKKKGGVVRAEQPNYFYGYFILPGALIKNDSDGTRSLHLWFQICKGKHDEALMWPIKKKLFLWLVHPTDKLIMESVYADTALQDFASYLRPRVTNNGELWSKKGVQIEFLEKRGFVKDDKLTVRFEVLP